MSHCCCREFGSARTTLCSEKRGKQFALTRVVFTIPTSGAVPWICAPHSLLYFVHLSAQKLASKVWVHIFLGSLEAKKPFSTQKEGFASFMCFGRSRCVQLDIGNHGSHWCRAPLDPPRHTWCTWCVVGGGVRGGVPGLLRHGLLLLPLHDPHDQSQLVQGPQIQASEWVSDLSADRFRNRCYTFVYKPCTDTVSIRGNLIVEIELSVVVGKTNL